MAAQDEDGTWREEQEDSPSLLWATLPPSLPPSFPNLELAASLRCIPAFLQAKGGGQVGTSDVAVVAADALPLKTFKDPSARSGEATSSLEP